MNDKIVFGQYYQSDSWLHKLDPRVKIISVFSLMISLFIIKNIYLLLGFMFLVLLVIASTKIPFVKFLNSIKMMTFVLLVTFVLQVIFRRDGELLKSFEFNLTYMNLVIIIFSLFVWFLINKYIKYFKTFVFLVIVLALFILQYYVSYSPLIVKYNINIYSNGLIMASYIVLRIITLLFLSSLLTFSTKPIELNNGLDYLLKPLQKLKVKTSIFTMMVSIALRFIPTLILETEKVLKAQASRGADFKEGKLSARVMQIVSLIVPMFVIAYKRAYDLADAMEARGYIPEGKRTSIYELKYKFLDYFSYVIVFLILAITIFLRVKYAL